MTVNVELKNPAPVNLLLSEREAAVQVTCEPGYRAISHNIYRSPLELDNYVLVGSSAGGGAVSYLDSPPVLGGYKYRVTAVSINGESAPSNEVPIDFTGMIPAPSNFTASDQVSYVRLQWNRVSSAVQYKIYRSSTSNNWTFLTSTTALTGADVPDQFGTYNYRVTAISSYGTESIPSMAVSVNFDGRIDAPQRLTIIDRGSNIYLTWEESEQAGQYYIYRSPGNENAYAKIDSTESANYTDHPDNQWTILL